MFDLSQDALDDLKETLQETFDDDWERIGGDLDEIAKLMGEANALTSASATTINTTLTKLLNYYGISTSQLGVDAMFASGTKYVPRKLRALIGENGREIATTNSGLVLTLNKGDGVIPSEMTENLLNMARGIVPNLALNAVSLPEISKAKLGETNIEQHYDSLIHIDGSADAATVEDIKKMSDELLDKSYKYTSKKIHDGYLKAGGRRVI